MPPRILHARRGEVIDAKKINEIIDGVNRLKSIVGKNGIKVKNSPKGVTISLPGKAYQMTDEPALAAKAMNESTTADIPAFGVAVIKGQVDDSAENYEWERVLVVDKPSNAFLYPICIATRKLLQEYDDGEDEWLLGGRAWVTGVCVVTLKRWFCADNDDVFLKRAIPHAGTTYAIASVDGPLEILWEEDFIGLSEHLAVVRFVTPVHTPLPFHNSGNNDTYFGCPIVPLAGDADGFVTSGSRKILAMSRAVTDAPHMVYVCLSITVNDGEDGWCAYPMGPFLGQVSASVSPGDPVGADTSSAVFVKDSFGFRVLAYLGTYAGCYWAILVRDTYVPLLKATSDPTGDAQTVETVSEDDVGSGHDITVNVPGS